jgi:hypothetical protein
MQIAGNTLVVLLLPLALLATFSLRDTFHAAGSDAVGPTFVMVIAVALRWLLAAVLIGLCVGCGGFDPLVPSRPLQWAIVAAVLFALDATAWAAVTAVSRSGVVVTPLQEIAGRYVGHALPLLAVLALAVPLNAPMAGSAAALWSAAVVLVLGAAATFAYFVAFDCETVARGWRTSDAAQAERDRVVQAYTVTLDAIPPDAPAARYASFFQEAECPFEVQQVVAQRLTALPDLDAQLLAMLADDGSRELAMQMIGHTRRLAEPAQGAALVEASRLLAHSYRDRLANPDAATSRACALAAMLATNLTLGGSESSVDFYPAIDAWHDALDRAGPDSSLLPSARYQVDQWLKQHPRPALPQG